VETVLHTIRDALVLGDNVKSLSFGSLEALNKGLAAHRPQSQHRLVPIELRTVLTFRLSQLLPRPHQRYRIRPRGG
jgi:nucleoid DNA-binding protein